MATFIPEIDKRQTKKRAMFVLRQYRKWVRIAGRPKIDIRSPLISDMPRTLGISFNKTEEALSEKVYAEMEKNAIEKALTALPLKSRQILSLTYCEREQLSIYEISLEMNYSEDNIKKLKSRALFEFAEAFKHGECLVKK